MLQNANYDTIQMFLAHDGITINDITISQTEIGDIVRVKTRSGNTYLFETVEPEKNTAHTYKHEFRDWSPQTGYIGLATISRIEIGSQIYFGKYQTTSPEEISHIKRVDLPNLT